MQDFLDSIGIKGATVISLSLGALVGLNRWLRREKLDKAQVNSAIGGAEASDKIRDHLVEEVERLHEKVKELAKRLDEQEYYHEERLRVQENKAAVLRSAALSCLRSFMSVECANKQCKDAMTAHLLDMVKGLQDGPK